VFGELGTYDDQHSFCSKKAGMMLLAGKGNLNGINDQE